MLFGDTIGPDELTQLLAMLCGRYLVDGPNGRVRLIVDRLPGDAVSAILPALPDGKVRVVLDTSKPNAYAHGRAMLREWWESYLQAEVTPDGHVEIVRQRAPVEDSFVPVPLHMEQEPA